MQMAIGQIVALTTYGNAFLSGWPRFNPGAFYPAHWTFRSCEHVRFVDLKPKDDGWEETTYASDPLGWFAQLEQESVYGLRMVRQSRDGGIPDHVRVAFAGGESWLLEAMTPTGSDFWRGRWEINRPVDTTMEVKKAKTGWLEKFAALSQPRKSRKEATEMPPTTWRVTYGRIARNQPTTDHPDIDLFDLKSQLAKTLREIRDFARDDVTPQVFA